MVKENIHELIRRGEIERAIDRLCEFLKDSGPKELYDDIVVLSGQFKIYEKGFLSDSASQIKREEVTRIAYAILDIDEEIREKIEDNSDKPREEIEVEDTIEKLEQMNSLFRKEFDEYINNIPERKKELRILINSGQLSLKEIEEKRGQLRYLNDIELSALKPTHHIPFVNRQREIENIEIFTGKTRYWLIDAPSGYGKTTLLKRLEERYIQKEHYIVAYVEIDDKDELHIIFNKFMKALEIEEEIKKIEMDQFGAMLWAKIFQQYREALNDNGFILLIDFNGRPSRFFELFQSRIIPVLWDAIRRIPQFTAIPDYFKVIYAGRYLSKRLFSPVVPISSYVNTILLSDFNYDAIRLTVNNHDNSMAAGFSREITAHILYLTGGHPLGISKALDLIGIQSPAYLIANRKEIYNLIKLVAESIEYELFSYEPWFFQLMQVCSLFRLVTLDMLKEIKNEILHLDATHEVDLERKILLTHLWARNWDRGVLSDGIARKVLAINLRQTEPQKYKSYCDFARNACLNKIRQGKSLEPRQWFIEYLYQSLIAHAPEINEVKEREKLINAFYDVEGYFKKGIEEYKATMLKDLPNVEREIDVIHEFIGRDKEFMFTVNYYLRNTEDYNNDPLDELKEKIKIELLK